MAPHVVVVVVEEEEDDDDDDEVVDDDAEMHVESLVRHSHADDV